MSLKDWDNQTRRGRRLLAEELGVSIMTIGNLVNGKYKPSIAQIISINKVTGLTVTQLDKELADQIELILEKGIL